MNKMKTLHTLILCILSIQFTTGQTRDLKIAKYLESKIQENNIPGLAISVIQNDNILFENYFGYSSLEFSTPVSEQTLFRIYSSTKMLINTLVFQLVEQQKVTLEEPISKYVSDVPENWNKVKIKDLMAHASGIPDFIAFDGEKPNNEVWNSLSKKELIFPTGHYHAYNQTNYWLLAQMIENISGQSLKKFTLESLFEGNSYGFTYSSNSSEEIRNRTSKYTYNHKLKSYTRKKDIQESRGFAGNGINITLPKLRDWAIKLNTNQYFSPETKEKMWEAYDFIEMPNFQFAQGWRIYESGENPSIGFTGGGVSAIRFYPKQGITILLMTNGYQFQSVHNDMVTKVAGIIDSKLIKHENELLEVMTSETLASNAGDLDSYLDRIRSKNPSIDIESLINSFGYKLLGYRKYNEAVNVFKYNTEAFPQSPNTFDSLGESYLYIDDFESALKNYQKVLNLEPKNRNALKMIEQINQRIAK